MVIVIFRHIKIDAKKGEKKMNNKLIGAIGFVVGAAVGSVITWNLVETKYRKLAEE